MIRHLYCGAALCAVFAAFISCSDTEVKISYVKAFTVLDYKNDTDKPDVRLAVFVETDGKIGRTEQIKIKSEEKGFEWTANNLITFANEHAAWASCLNFVCPNNAMIPSGLYALTLTDAEGKEEKTSFVLHYPENMAFETAAQLEKSALGNFRAFCASYDEKGTLLSYEEGAKSPGALFAERTDALSFRRCLELLSGSVYCLMPPVYRDKTE